MITYLDVGLAGLTDLTAGRRDGAISATTKRVAAAELQAQSTGET